MKRIIFSLATMSLFLMSCGEQETDCDKVISKVVSVINSENKETVDFYIDDDLRGLDRSFDLELPYIVIDGNYHNLCLLRRFSTDNNSIVLFF